MSARAAVVVDFFADLSCPWCYVGWEALKRAATDVRESVAVSLAWRSFLLSPDASAEGYDRKAYLSQRFQPEQLAQANAVLRQAAMDAGAPINLDAAARLPNTVDAHRLVHWTAEYGAAEPMIDALFSAYFVDGRDISEHAVLLELAEALGHDPQEMASRLASDADRPMVLEFHNAASRIGIRGVPVAILNRRTPLMGAQSVDAYAQALRQA